MAEVEESSGPRENGNGIINDGEGLLVEEGNVESERGESGNVGDRRRKSNLNAEVVGVPMSALPSPNTGYSGRSVRNGDVRTETEGTVEEEMDGIEEPIGVTERWNRTRGNGMKVLKLELNNWKRFKASIRMLDDLRIEFWNSNMLMRYSIRRQEKIARNEDMFLMLQLLKVGTEEYEKIKTEMYNRILPDTGSSCKYYSMT